MADDMRSEILHRQVQQGLNAAYAEGMRDILLDLWDAGLLGTEAVEFAVENNAAPDPRRR